MARIIRNALCVCVMAAVLVGAAFAAGCGNTGLASSSDTGSGIDGLRFVTYSDAAYGFSIDYPEGWTAKQDVESAAIQFFAPFDTATDSFCENLNIIVQDLSKRLTLSQYTQLSLEQLKNLGDPQVELDNAILAAAPAKQAVYVISADDAALEFRQVWTVKDRRAYILTFTSELNRYPEYADIFTQMAGSFKLGE